MFYRVHRNDIPAFSAENAFSSPWGEDINQPCPKCEGTGEYFNSRMQTMRECPDCNGTGQVDIRVRGYSCCESAEMLIRYFENRGGCEDNVPVVIFHGRQVGSGTDNEPLVVPAGRPRWTTYEALKAHVERRCTRELSHARI